MTSATAHARAITIAALLCFPFLLAACSDSVDEGSTECGAGEIYNPVVGECRPRSSGNSSSGNSSSGNNGLSPLNNAMMGDAGGTDNSETGGDAGTTSCTGNERRCNGADVEICRDGAFVLVESCGTGFFCNLGNCLPEETNSCVPGTVRCASRTATETCGSDGESWDPAVSCGADEECQGGVCTRSCAGFIDKKSNIGCEYVTMRHDQRTGIRTLPHTVVVSNPNTESVTVQVSGPPGVNTGIQPQTVQANDSAVLNFPVAPMVSTAGISANIYTITSSLPVIATQFSPLNNPGLGSETSDASLLLPTNAVGNEYVVLGWRASEPGGTWIDVVATKPNTTVTVETPIPLSGGAAGSISANSTRTFTIAQKQVLHLEENRGFFSSGTRDVSGVRITSNEPIAVYTGATIAAIPDAPPNPSSDPNCLPTPASGAEASAASCVDHDSCCSGLCGHDPGLNTNYCMDGLAALDHIEQQLFPVESWGTSYVGVPFPARNIRDYTIFRVIAANDGTSITLDPPVDGVTNITLDRGDYRQFQSRDAFELTANQPVMLAQFMIGGSISSSDDGDPAFLGPPAVQQYRDSYVFLVPGNYRKNRVTIVKKASASITLDGALVPQASFTAVGAGTWEHATIESVGPGVHNATSGETFGIVVHGVDEYISYAFAGGVTLPE